jgi:RNA polymerase sigma factor (sigma-70 family)
VTLAASRLTHRLQKTHPPNSALAGGSSSSRRPTSQPRSSSSSSSSMKSTEEQRLPLPLGSGCFLDSGVGTSRRSMRRSATRRRSRRATAFCAAATAAVVCCCSFGIGGVEGFLSPAFSLLSGKHHVAKLWGSQSILPASTKSAASEHKPTIRLGTSSGSSGSTPAPGNVLLARAAPSSAEAQLYEAIREENRLRAIVSSMEKEFRRSPSVGEWAASAGYDSSEALMAALQGGRKAKQSLVESYRPLVAAIARQYSGATRSLAQEDLVQEGNIGLLRAAQLFDAARGTTFGSYAGEVVRGTILRAMADKDRSIRVPVYMQGIIKKCAKKSEQLEAMLGRAPTQNELARALDLPPDLVQQALSCNQSEQWRGLVQGDAESAFKALGLHEVQVDVQAILSRFLAPNEMLAVQLRFGVGERNEDGPLSFREVGDAMHISTEGIRKMVGRALKKLSAIEAETLLEDYLNLA